MAITFPSSPTPNQLFTNNGRTWIYNYNSTVTRTNLISNPNFEVDTSTWSTSGTVVRTTAESYSGVASASLTYAGSGTVLIQQSTRSTVTAGLTYTASFYLKQSVDAGSVICNFMWYNAGGSLILDDTHQTNNPNTAWQRFSQTLTAPTNAASCSFRIYQSAGEGGGAVATVNYVDAVLFEQASSALPYFDGTYADTYTDYTLITQAWSGTANASTSTATWGLTTSQKWQAYTQAISNNSVSSAMIVDGTIVDADIASATITGAKLAANAAVTNIGFTPASTGKSIAMAIVFGG